MIEIKANINKAIHILKQNKWIHYCIIIIIGIILSIPLCNIQIRTTHDGALHFLRIIGTADTLKSGQFPPIINQNYCNGSGYSMNLFYPPLVTYIPLLIKAFMSNYMDALKIFGAICIILSGLTMYELSYEVTKKRGIALFAGIFYLIAPYKLANVYKRYAIGEFTALLFIPLVFLGIINLFQGDKKKHYYIAIGGIGLMLSHTVSTLYTAIFCVIYILFNIKKLKEKQVVQKCIINAIFILFVTMLFWLPLLEASQKAEYGIMNDGAMGTNKYYTSKNVISFSQLFKDKGEENGTTFLIGMPTFVILLTTIFLIKKIDIKYKDFYLLCIIFAFISLFMVSKFFPWIIMPSILCKLQYPWRMVGFFNFFVSFICGVNLYMLLKYIIKKDFLKVLVTLIFTIWAVYSGLQIIMPFLSEDKQKDKEYEEYIVEHKKISHMQINRDYMPYKALHLQNTYVKTREDRTYILIGNGQITEENKQNLKDELKIENIEKDSQLEFPYYYYPGYEIQLVTQNYSKKLQAIESDNGYLACNINEEIKEGKIVINYVGTIITYVSYIVSAISFVIFIIYIVKEKQKS